MAELEATLYTYLSTHAGLVALVSTRIYPLTTPQGVTFPALTYQRISGARTHTASGTCILARPRIQFKCWGTSYSSAKAVAAQVRAALDGYKATHSAWASTVDNEIDDYDPETGHFAVTVDVLFWQAG